MSDISSTDREYIGNCSGPADATLAPFDTGALHGPWFHPHTARVAELQLVRDLYAHDRDQRDAAEWFGRRALQSLRVDAFGQPMVDAFGDPR